MNLKSVQIMRFDIVFLIISLLEKIRFFGRCLENCQVFSGGRFLTFGTHYLTLNNSFKKLKNMHLFGVF